MDFSRLYRLSCAMRRGYLHFYSPREPSARDYWNALLAGKVCPDEPIELRRMEGTKTGDFLSADTVRIKLVSCRIVALFEEERFTGWSTYGVKVFGKTGEITGYKGLSVLGRCGPIDESKARLEWVEPDPRLLAGFPPWRSPRPEAVQEKFGLYFDPDTWDGSDFFIPEESAWIIVTERVAKALKRARATNVSLTPLTEQRLP